MPEEGALRLTTALYYGPDGRTIQARGIIPEIRIETGKESQSRRREADLPRSLPAGKRGAEEKVSTVFSKACPAIKGGRTYSSDGEAGDRALGCAVAYLEAGSKHKFLAAHGQARNM